VEEVKPYFLIALYVCWFGDIRVFMLACYPWGCVILFFIHILT